MSSNCVFRWVHFSDIHFQVKDVTFNTTQLREKLPQYLKENIKEDVDALIFSGDFRYAPEKEENPQRVIDYIRNIAAAVSITDMKKVITVPGNHDLSRDTSRTYIARGVIGEYNADKGVIEQGALENLISGFAFYRKLHEQLKNIPSWTDTNPHYIVELEKCNLLLLNTALTSYGDEDKGQLILGSSYVSSLIGNIQNSKPIIAIGHHSLDELKPSEKKTITHYFDQQGIRLYMCGHTHETWCQGFGEQGRSVTTGCMVQSDNDVDVSFCVGELQEDGSVSIISYKWDMKQKVWSQDLANKKEFSALYKNVHYDAETERTGINVVEKEENSFSIDGYTLIGPLGCDGIKYFWSKGDKRVESIALNKRLKNAISAEDNVTSAYTISTSFGCMLSAMQKQCRFCETGARSFEGNLTAEDIALQCIFMAEFDSNCPSYPQVRDNMREFAFMGQGEPGYNYPAIRQAIIMNDYIMKQLDQKVSRYIISTCGVSDLILALIQDIKKGLFANKITLHLSLHDIDDARSEIMPINEMDNYKDIIEYCKILYHVTHEKVGVGVLMFDDFHADGVARRTLTEDRLEKILSVLDNEAFRVDLCSVNRTSVGEQRHQLSNETATKLRSIAESKGFEVKLFTSFGDNQKSGCGMLNSCIDDIEKPGNKTITHFNKAVSLLKDAKEYYLYTLEK